MEMLINALLSRGADRRRLQVKLFGGAQMHDHHATVGQKNVAFILKYVQQEGLDLVAKHLGGTEAKKVIFEPLTGRAWLKCIPFTEVRQVVREEDKYASRLDRESHRSHDDDVELF
jgi:chemotaxis protein CheD